MLFQDWNHEVDKNDLSWDEGKKALSEEVDLPTNRDKEEKESLKSIIDAPSSGAVENLEIKGFNSDSRGTGITNLHGHGVHSQSACICTCASMGVLMQQSYVPFLLYIVCFFKE